MGRLPLAAWRLILKDGFIRFREVSVARPAGKDILTLTLFAASLLALLFLSPSLFAQSTDGQASSAPPSDSQLQSSQDIKPIPVLQASAGFISTFDGGEPHLGPIITPVLLVPIGQRWLFETRATFESDLTQQPGTNGFHGTVDKEVEYAQLDFIANQYMTVTLGRFLTPFGIYNERLYPVWIRNLATDPLTLPIGVGPSNASTGAMVRGGFKANSSFNINYAVYYSALSTVSPVDSSRFAGVRMGIFVPKARLEIGGSFQHLLQDDHSNLYGFHLIWQPRALPLDIRAETARSTTGSGYWVESAYRLSQLPFAQNELRRTQLVARMQQFYTGTLPNESVLPANTNMFEFGMNYYFQDDFRAMSSYGRQFSPQGNANVWTIGLTYRLVMPLGRGEVQ
ncbi:MAG: hypothetical protein WA789_11230 [Candidatus Acidiferrum sp.]